MIAGAGCFEEVEMNLFLERRSFGSGRHLAGWDRIKVVTPYQLLWKSEEVFLYIYLRAVCAGFDIAGQRDTSDGRRRERSTSEDKAALQRATRMSVKKHHVLMLLFFFFLACIGMMLCCRLSTSRSNWLAVTVLQVSAQGLRPLQ